MPGKKVAAAMAAAHRNPVLFVDLIAPSPDVLLIIGAMLSTEANKSQAVAMFGARNLRVVPL
jgi:hypothetical protein